MKTDDIHDKFLADIRRLIPRERIYTDALRTLAWGTDAGFYRLLPRIVVRSVDEAEVANLLRLATKRKVPVTFRAAGTSLSGQAITDSVLIVAGKHWEKWRLSDDHSTIALQPGIVGEHVNEILKPYGLTFAPDPASKRSAMVGGIVANNASGMNCGTHANSDRQLRSARIVMADGTILDTGDEASRREFAQAKPEFIARIEELRDRIRANTKLAERIRFKYSIKNVTGLNLLPFVVHDDPFDIIAHLMVGSEGTLGFLSEVTMATSHLYPCTASAMLYFEDMREACEAVVALKGAPVFSAEILDKKSLSSVGDTTGEGLTAILTETRGDTPEEVEANIRQITEVLRPFRLYKPVQFTSDASECARLWGIRAGVFPAVGGTREPGTTVIIEDIAFHIADLPNATIDLVEMLERHGYSDACIYGHAFEGNYHFIIAQRFDTEADIARYRNLMTEVERLVVDKYDGSLKAEHGTGRNMAPFVVKEWGEEAFSIMKEVKQLFDPDNLLNPGVIFNDDPDCFVKHLKPLPLASAQIDKCIECGFCEVHCLTCGFTLSARQRIVAYREIARLKRSGADPGRLAELEEAYRYNGQRTCAGDGMCATSCPMGINTGELIHELRAELNPAGSMGHAVADIVADNFATVKALLRPALSVASAAQRVIGPKATDAIGRALHRIGLPLWTASLPTAYYPHKFVQGHSDRKVVYFPSCINQTMGFSHGQPVKESLIDVMVKLLAKSGYEVVFPEKMKSLCCGTIWSSKGMPDIADRKAEELRQALLKASDGGRLPILCDQSPCLQRMRATMTGLRLYEPAEFIYDYCRPHLTFHPISEPIAVHLTCSTRKMGVAPKLLALARLCATEVVVPEGVECCGFAGDKGFTRPEINAYALRKLRKGIEASGAREGYSNSRTCEVGLTTHSGIPYQSIAYLVDRCTTAHTTE